MINSHIIIDFGDVFRYKEREYVYLLEYGSIVYAARILNEEETEKFSNLYNRQQIRGDSAQGLLGKQSLCFVILSTEEFRKRAVHLGIPLGYDIGSLQYNNAICCLNRKDKEEIIKEIKTGPVARGLKQAFEKTYELDPNFSQGSASADS